ncbi:MAG: 2-oxoglutarate synthase [Deltaproteobacteria bacterium]|nr:2-oxoglutarate synthase [Deltaproteobacteria bacterium]
MATLLDPRRPPAFCPGCAHERCLHALDRALVQLGLSAGDVVVVSDIGCSGLMDTFFATHAFHGLHGRALTYAAGIKLARPHLHVIVTMGDGGVGIGGAHFLEACRRNLNLSLLILNNFNFGMTGGQFSCTTPPDASTASGFLQGLEKPLDICAVAAAAGAPFVARSTVYQRGLSQLLSDAIAFPGFSVVDIWGPCTGRYAKRNPMRPEDLEEKMAQLPTFRGPIPGNRRPEYGGQYRALSGKKPPMGPTQFCIETDFFPAVDDRREVILAGAAGNRIISAGTLLAHGAVAAGMHVTQKNDHHITVMKGPSVSEIIISPVPVGFTGVECPDAILAVAQEGVLRTEALLGKLLPTARIIAARDLSLPPVSAHTLKVDFSAHGIRRSERALAAVALLARTGDPITVEMLRAAIARTLQGKALEESLNLLARTETISLAP